MTMSPGTGVFIPAYAAAKQSKREGSRKCPQTSNSNDTSQCSGRDTLSSSICSMCTTMSDSDAFAAAHDTNFSSNCSVLTASSPLSPYAAVNGDGAVFRDTQGLTHTAYPNLPSSGGLVGQQQLLLPQPVYQSVLSSDDAAEMALLLQQELELDAAINNLLNLKLQLASIDGRMPDIRQQPPIIPSQQVLSAMHTSAPLPVYPAGTTGSTTAMQAYARWADSLSAPSDEVLAVQAMDLAAIQVQQQQQLMLEQQHLQECMQAEVLQLLPLVCGSHVL